MNPIEMQNTVKKATRNRTRYVYSLVNKEFFKIDVPVTKTNYKIAIIFSGGLRNFHITQEWANKFLIDPLKADVFFHGWCNKDGINNNEQIIKNYHNVKNYKILEMNKNPVPMPEIMKTKFPRNMSQGLGLIQAEHILGQLFNIQNSYDVMEEYEKKSNIKYDIVIRARPDVFWYATIEDKDLDIVMNNYCIATPQHYMYAICGNNINDQFAMGKSDVIKAYTRMYDKVEEYAHIAPNDEATEFYVTHHVRDVMKIPIHDIDMTFMLDYPSDYEMEKGFSNNTMRHIDQNDSGVAPSVVEQIRKGQK